MLTKAPLIAERCDKVALIAGLGDVNRLDQILANVYA